MNTDQVIKVNMLHTIIEPRCRRVNHKQPLTAAAWDRNSTIPMAESRRALTELEDDGVIEFRDGMWRIIIYGKDNDVLCPVCGEPLSGTVKTMSYECPLAPDGNDDSIYHDDFRAKDSDTELVEVKCDECGLTVPNEMVDFRGRV